MKDLKRWEEAFNATLNLDKYNETVRFASKNPRSIRKDLVYKTCVKFLDMVQKKFPLPNNPDVTDLPAYTLNRTAYWLKDALKILYEDA
jgi:hypothetical protein